MSLDKTSSDFENFAIRFVTDIILIPQTIYKLLVESSFPSSYTSSELVKAENERFKHYVSPIKLSLYCLILLLLFPATKENLNIAQIADTSKFSELEKCLYYFVIAHLVPLLLTIVISIIKAEPLSKENYKQPFYTLVYVTSYVYLPITIMFAITSLINVFIDLDYVTNSDSVNPVIRFSLIFLLAIPFAIFILWSNIKFLMAAFSSFHTILKGDKWCYLLSLVMIVSTYFLFYGFLLR